MQLVRNMQILYFKSKRVRNISRKCLYAIQVAFKMSLTTLQVNFVSFAKENVMFLLQCSQQLFLTVLCKVAEQILKYVLRKKSNVHSNYVV